MGTLEKLEAAPVLDTVRRLHERISARFPERGLCRVAGELVSLVEEVTASAAASRGRLHVLRPLSRVAMVAIVALVVFLFVVAVRSAVREAPDDGLEWVPLLESGVNDLVFAAIATWFLWSVPERLERSAMLDLLHRLRSLAHIVDMHQLTKDPERLRSSFSPTPASATMNLTPDQLEYYLDYCSELLSLVAKAAALCAEGRRDQVLLDSVASIETLTVGLDTTIRQKIAVLNEARREWQAAAQALVDPSPS